MNVRNPIFIPVWMELIYLLSKGYNLHTISNYMHRSYSYLHKLVTVLVERGWITPRRKVKGGTVSYVFTETGNKIVELCQSFVIDIEPYLDEELLGIGQLREKGKFIERDRVE